VRKTERSALARVPACKSRSCGLLREEGRQCPHHWGPSHHPIYVRVPHFSQTFHANLGRKTPQPNGAPHNSGRPHGLSVKTAFP